MAKILFVDSDQNMLNAYRRIMNRTRHECFYFPNHAEVFNNLSPEENIDVVITELHFDPALMKTKSDHFNYLRGFHPTAKFILITSDPVFDHNADLYIDKTLLQPKLLVRFINILIEQGKNLRNAMFK